MLSFFKRLRSKPRAAAVYQAPKDQRIYAIGDVHGCAAELDQLLHAIRLDSSECQLRKRLVFLGDLVDRGPASAQVVDRLHRRELPIDDCTFILGNHEEVMLDVYDGLVDRSDGWLSYGGLQTLESYGISSRDILRWGDELPLLMRDKIPSEHVQFLRTFVDQVQFGDYVFVHAGIRPGIALADQKAPDLHWIRREFLEDESDHGVIVVHGHTISNEPDVRCNRIGVDTGCYKSGKLTAVVLEGAERRFICSGEARCQNGTHLA